jgi:hypothetical protein
MRRPLGVVVAFIGLALPSVVSAQKGQQVFDLLLQGAQQEVYRQQQLEADRHRRQEMSRLHELFLAQWNACFRDDLAACNEALAHPYLNSGDRRRLLAKRSDILVTRREAGERAHRDRVEAQYLERQRQRERELQAERERERQREQEIAQLREEAERQRQRAELAERERQKHPPPQIAAVTQTQSLQTAQPQEVRTFAWLWIAASLVAVAIGFGLAYAFRNVLTRLMQRMRRSAPIASAPQAAPEPGPAADRNQISAPDIAQAAGEKPRDTVGAMAAMELAYAFIEEVRAAETPGLEDKEARKQLLNTLSLASRQLDAAEKLDPDAILEGQDEGDTPLRFTINELKSEALLLEGLTHQVYDLKRAIPALVGATKADSNNARAFFILGLTHAANMNKTNAVAAFQRAVELDPKNIKYRKELSRTESLSAAEIAGYKATRAGERIYDAGIATANAGIMAWNVFAVIWNIVTFPLRMLFAIFRMLRLHPFA